MKDTYHLSGTEQEIMEKIWEEPMRQTELLEKFNAEGKNWGRQTLNTLIIRLEHRGFVDRKDRIVVPVLSKEEFGLKIIEEAAEQYLTSAKKKKILSLTQNK